MAFKNRRPFDIFSQLDQAVITRYCVASALAAAVLLLTSLLSNALDGARYSPALIAVMVSSLYGGFGPGLVTTLITGVGIPTLFPGEPLPAEPDRPGHFYQLTLFETAALLVSVVGSLARTARKKREEGSLHTMEDRFRTLVGSVRDFGIFMLDESGRIITWNPGAERILGYEASEAIGRHFSSLRPAEDIARGLPERALAVAAREGRYEEEGLRIRKDGSSYWAHIVITPLRDDEGRLYGFSKIIRDMSGQRKAEEERSRLVSKLKEALRARDEFLSIASHEFKTPLTTLQLQVQSLQRAGRESAATEEALKEKESPHSAIPRITSKLAMIERQVGRMTELINNLLDVTGIMAGRFRLKIEEVDLAAVTRDIVARLRGPLKDAGCDLVLSADAPVVGRWSRLRVEGIVTNLLLNAIKYGSGKPIEVTVSATPTGARLVVCDHGIGIADGDQARIFERYERAVSEQYSGIGVGLWVVRQTVEAFGGSVRVKSAIGAGATFTVDLPLEVSGNCSLPPPLSSDTNRAA
jgi:PAS domain S-box-containing protein